MDAKAQAPDLDFLSRGQIPVGRRLWLDPNPEHAPLLGDRIVQKAICGMQMNRQRSEGLAQIADAGDVIEVRMREEDR